MWKLALAGTTALAIAGSSLAYAQQQPAPSGEQQQQQRERWRPSAADLNAFTDARIAALKAGLQLTPDQEKNWPPVEQAIRDIAKAQQERFAARADQRSSDPIDRLRQRADQMTQDAANLKKLADAAQPLYQSLGDDQKHRLMVLMRALRPHQWRFAQWRDHGPREVVPR